ncbi:MAG: hypothetical protein ACP5QI_07695, partial [Candidatus Bathyarchaeia archaeon]
MRLIKVRLAAPALLLLITLAAGLTTYAQPAKTVVTTFRWERSLEVGGSEMPLKISIPILLSVAGLPDKAQPGETVQLRVELTPSEGAFIQLSDKTV